MAKLGGKRPGAGRKPGSISKKAAAQEVLAIETGMTPLEFLMSIYRDIQQDIKIRVEAAKAAAPYVHKKMPMQLEAKIDVTADDLVRRIQEGKERARVIDVDPVVIEALEQQED